MMQHPAILALLTSSFIISLMMLYAGWYGIQILEKWDLNSGSELQLILERRTYLISTILSYALVFQILSLFLYIYTADEIHGLFTGAMCAAGTLNVNSDGYPTLILKIVNCILAGVWLIVNYADTRGYDYPLIKVKYALLIILAPLVLLEPFPSTVFFTTPGGMSSRPAAAACSAWRNRGWPGISQDFPPASWSLSFLPQWRRQRCAGLFSTERGGEGISFPP